VVWICYPTITGFNIELQNVANIAYCMHLVNPLFSIIISITIAITAINITTITITTIAITTIRYFTLRLFLHQPLPTLSKARSTARWGARSTVLFEARSYKLHISTWTSTVSSNAQSFHTSLPRSTATSEASFTPTSEVRSTSTSLLQAKPDCQRANSEHVSTVRPSISELCERSQIQSFLPAHSKSRFFATREAISTTISLLPVKPDPPLLAKPVSPLPVMLDPPLPACSQQSQIKSFLPAHSKS